MIRPYYTSFRGLAIDLRVGVHHGIYCVGCCWGLMLILVAVGENPKFTAAVIAGLLTGASIATYTVWDKYAVSMAHVSPILLDLLGNPVQAFLLTPLVWRQRTEIPKYWATNKPELFGVTILNPISYILVLIAMTRAPVSQIAPTREISTLVGALVGGRLLAEQHLRRRLAAASIIVIGVIAVAHG